MQDIARPFQVERAREGCLGQQGVLDDSDDHDDCGRGRAQVDDPGRLLLSAEDEIGGREEGNHRDDVALDGEVPEEVQRIDGRAPGGVDELADDGSEDRKPSHEPQ